MGRNTGENEARQRLALEGRHACALSLLLSVLVLPSIVAVGIPHFNYCAEYMETRKKSSRTRTNGRRKSAAVVQPSPAAHVRRSEQRTIRFLTQDELRQLFKVIRSKRDKAIFLVAYRRGLRASEIGLLQ